MQFLSGCVQYVYSNGLHALDCSEQAHGTGAAEPPAEKCEEETPKLPDAPVQQPAAAEDKPSHFRQVVKISRDLVVAVSFIPPHGVRG